MGQDAHDLHAIVEQLRRESLLREVRRPVDRSWEISAVLDALERDGDFSAVVFRDVTGFPGWSVLGNLYADRRAIAALFDTTVDRLSAEFGERLQHPIDPVVVPDGPAHENVHIGGSLDDIPLPTLHEKDAGPYLSLGVAICRDPDTGARNVGVYRFMQRDSRELVPSLTSISNAADIFAKYERRGEPMDIAILPGVSPALALAASYRAPGGTDECALAGGLAGEPLALVKARTVDLEVPATAEVVIEARVLPGARYPEAPFADMSRSYSRQKQGPLVEVSAITHRDNPIFQLAFSGHADASNMAAVCHEVAIQRAVDVATSCVRSVHVPASGYGFHCYLAVDKKPTIEGGERGEQRNAMLAALGAVPQIKLIAAFDADVDIFDDAEVLGALARRFQAVDPLTGRTRFEALANMKGATYDPSSFHREFPNAKLMIDATIPSGLDAQQRAGFDEARCAGADRIRLADYFPAEGAP
jgi:2,5-furandicarboxylate decarboxylase 1